MLGFVALTGSGELRADTHHVQWKGSVTIMHETHNCVTLSATVPPWHAAWPIHSVIHAVPLHRLWLCLTVKLRQLALNACTAAEPSGSPHMHHGPLHDVSQAAAVAVLDLQHALNAIQAAALWQSSNAQLDDRCTELQSETTRVEVESNPIL